MQKVGTAGIIKVWDTLSGRLKTNICVGAVILRMVWISLRNVQAGLVVGLEDGSVILYQYCAPSGLSKLRNIAFGVMPSRFVCHLCLGNDHLDLLCEEPRFSSFYMCNESFAPWRNRGSQLL